MFHFNGSPYGYYQEQALPPGKYMYSPQFPQMMQQLSPVYMIPTEPVFVDHLMMQLNKPITVVTVAETLAGTLTGVAVDHLQLTINDVDHHIRYQHIIYFKEE